MPPSILLEKNLKVEETRKFPNLEGNGYSPKNINVGVNKIKFEPIPFEKIGLRKK